MATAINALGASDAAAVRAYSIASNGSNGETVLFPDTTDATAKYDVAVDWVIETGYSDFVGQTYADPVMCVGYNVAVGGRKDSGEISVGMFFEADYYLTGGAAPQNRYSEAYIATRGGSTNDHNRPLFFQWDRVTGVLTGSQVHAAGAGGATGFVVIAPTNGGAESGTNLWNLQANNLTGYSFPTTTDCTLTLGESGTSTAKGVFNLKYAGTAHTTIQPGTSSQLQITTRGASSSTGELWFRAGVGGGVSGGCLSIGSSSSAATLVVDNSASSSTSAIGMIVKQKASASVNLVEFQNSGGTPQVYIDKDFNIRPKVGAASQTQGFVYVPSGAGAAGTPGTTLSGQVPMFVDESGNRVGFYYGGAWKYAALT